jgi:hypothetical protein
MRWRQTDWPAKAAFRIAVPMPMGATPNPVTTARGVTVDLSYPPHAFAQSPAPGGAPLHLDRPHNLLLHIFQISHGFER